MFNFSYPDKNEHETCVDEKETVTNAFHFGGITTPKQQLPISPPGSLFTFGDINDAHKTNTPKSAPSSPLFTFGSDISSTTTSKSPDIVSFGQISSLSIISPTSLSIVSKSQREYEERENSSDYTKVEDEEEEEEEEEEEDEENLSDRKIVKARRKNITSPPPTTTTIVIPSPDSGDRKIVRARRRKGESKTKNHSTSIINLPISQLFLRFKGRTLPMPKGLILVGVTPNEKYLFMKDNNTDTTTTFYLWRESERQHRVYDLMWSATARCVPLLLTNEFLVVYFPESEDTKPELRHFTLLDPDLNIIRDFDAESDLISKHTSGSDMELLQTTVQIKFSGILPGSSLQGVIVTSTLDDTIGKVYVLRVELDNVTQIMSHEISFDDIYGNLDIYSLTTEKFVLSSHVTDNIYIFDCSSGSMMLTEKDVELTNAINQRVVNLATYTKEILLKGSNTLLINKDPVDISQSFSLDVFEPVQSPELFIKGEIDEYIYSKESIDGDLKEENIDEIEHI